MDYRRVGTRGFLFTWKEPYVTNVYVIDAAKHVYVLDTFLGPEPMQAVKARLAEEGVSGKPFVAFNSHADYDHYWGNQEFADGWIIAHDSALRRVHTQGEEGLKTYGAQAMGEVKLTAPNLLFRRKLTLPEDRLEFLYSPGHTGDSASCWDPVDRVLFTGDNVEAPFPQLNLLNLKEWQASLEEYLKLEPRWVVAGHDPLMEELSLIRDNLEYVKGLQSLKVSRTGWSEDHRRVHYANLRRLGSLYAEKGDPKKAVEHYREALAVLDEMERSEENAGRMARVQEAIRKLGG